MYFLQIEMMSEAIDETLDKDEAEEETEELTNQVRYFIYWYIFVLIYFFVSLALFPLSFSPTTLIYKLLTDQVLDEIGVDIASQVGFLKLTL